MTSLKDDRKFIYNIVATLVFLLLMILLFITGNKEGEHKYYYPIVTDSALYTPITGDDELIISMEMKEDVSLSALSLLSVNLDPEGEGYIDIALLDSYGVILNKVSVAESEITVGSWSDVSVNAELLKGNTYSINIKANGCEPYFMYVPSKGEETLPYTVSAFLNGDELSSSVSVGLSENREGLHIRRDYCVYFLIVFICFIFLLIHINTGFSIFSKEMAMSDIFIFLVFLFVAVTVYSEGYKNGVFISADSSGYLREAVNLKVGNGYSYDGLAGYDTWFANWPILYPFLIFLFMLTGLDPYIASKVLTVLIVAVFLLVLRVRFREKAWIYSLVALNLGFLTIMTYTWSEIPFMLLLVLVGLKLSDIVTSNEAKVKDYVLFGIFAFLTFLTRYFGIYLFAVPGIYILIYGIKWIRNKDKGEFLKALKMTVTCAVSGILCVGYLLLNKIMNGMPSGVSRTDWWDDYAQLTKDLIDSLLKEIFNVIHIDITNAAALLPYPLKVIFILLVIAGILVLVKRRCRLYSMEAVFLMLAGTYYVMFTVIRYFSSMDTFYFRFFEPATMLLSIGLVGLIFRGERISGIKNYIYAIVLSLVLIGITETGTEGLMWSGSNYLDVVKSEWDLAYKEIPERSVVIFSDLDFRSEYYRPDVVSGEITTETTVEDLKNTYYGSKYLCIQREYADAMIDSGEYTEEITTLLSEGISNDPSAEKYIAIELNALN